MKNNLLFSFVLLCLILLISCSDSEETVEELQFSVSCDDFSELDVSSYEPATFFDHIGVYKVTKGTELEWIMDNEGEVQTNIFLDDSAPPIAYYLDVSEGVFSSYSVTSDGSLEEGMVYDIDMNKTEAFYYFGEKDNVNSSSIMQVILNVYVNSQGTLIIRDCSNGVILDKSSQTQEESLMGGLYYLETYDGQWPPMQ